MSTCRSAGSIDEIERLGYGDNTLIFYIWGDNGSSGEGQNGTISELLAQNGIPTTVDMHIKALDELGGLDVLGSPEGRQPVPRRLGVGRQHAVQGHEAARLASRRHPQPDGDALARTDRARPDAARPSSSTATTSCRRSTRSSGITPPLVVHGVEQDPIDGVSFAYTFDDRRRARAAAHAVLRDHGQPGDLSRRLDGLRVRTTDAVAARPAARHPRLDARPGHLGAVQPRRGLVPSQRPRRASSPRSWRR